MKKGCWLGVIGLILSLSIQESYGQLAGDFGRMPDDRFREKIFEQFHGPPSPSVEEFLQKGKTSAIIREFDHTFHPTAETLNAYKDFLDLLDHVPGGGAPGTSLQRREIGKMCVELKQRLGYGLLEPAHGEEIYIEPPMNKMDRHVTFKWKIFLPHDESTGNSIGEFKVCVRHKGKTCTKEDGALLYPVGQAWTYTPPEGLPVVLQGKQLEWNVLVCGPGEACKAYPGCFGRDGFRALPWKLPIPELKSPQKNQKFLDFSPFNFRWEQVKNQTGLSYWKIQIIQNRPRTNEKTTMLEALVTHFSEISGVGDTIIPAEPSRSMPPDTDRVGRRQTSPPILQPEPLARVGSSRLPLPEQQKLLDRQRYYKNGPFFSGQNGFSREDTLNTFSGPTRWRVSACNDDVGCTWSEERTLLFPLHANVCVRDMRTSFSNISPVGQKLGFWMNGHKPEGDQNPLDFLDYLTPFQIEKASHMQGIQRLPGKPYLIVSASSEKENPGHFYVVKMNSRPSAGRFRSNRLTSNRPPREDGVVHPEFLKILPNDEDFTHGFLQKTIPEGEDIEDLVVDKHTLHHAGGIQAIGDYLAIGLGHAQGQQRARTAFYEMTNPEKPRKLPYEILGERAGSVAIARQNNGKYLLIVQGSEKDPKEKSLLFYQSENSNLEDPKKFKKLEPWTKDQLRKGTSDGIWRNYQNINLFQACESDALYLVGFGFRPSDEVSVSKNKLKAVSLADLFEITFPHTNTTPVITKLKSKIILCRDACNFAAGGGMYVAEDGELMVYGVEHFVRNGLVRVNENRMTSDNGISDIEKAWVEIYKGKELSLDLTQKSKRRGRIFRGLSWAGHIVVGVGVAIGAIALGGIYVGGLIAAGSIYYLAASGFATDEKIREYIDRRADSVVLIEYVDKDKRNYQRYKDFEGFDNAVSSVTWKIPHFWNYLMFKDEDYKGKMLTLGGVSRQLTVTDLGVLGMDNEISSSRFSKASIEEPSEGWIELYEEPEMEGRRLAIQGMSFISKINNYEYISVEGKRGFQNKVSSVRYQLPKGTVYRLYAGADFVGPYYDLIGTGYIEEISDLILKRFPYSVLSSQYFDQ